ncbi:E3 ubiquitin-protein ligase TRIM33-like [Amphiura filiformis]|uniref:E3 ubiquitin-protein ligase TRIM33-like n=1 Tax=Amphiura filiformis TaxID=82378 RepID=UPI003B21F511
MERSKSFIEEEDLTKCGICLSTIETPKALPCLHTFCLSCLQELVKENHDKISCTLCQEEVTVPPNGADGFRNNFFVEKLKERKAIWEMKQKDVNLSCSCCGAMECETVAHCSDCKGFLCSKCTDLHDNIAPLRNHRVFTVKELRSGKVDVGKDMKEEYCYEHKDQLLRFFCNTCGIPICRDCTVLEHSRPEHNYVHLENVTDGQMAEIKQLVDNCKDVVMQADSALEKSDRIKTDLKAALNKAQGMLWRATEYAKAQLLENLQDSHNALARSLRNLENARCGKIDTEQTNLLNLKAKLHNAMEMATQVVKSGSKHDLALSYTALAKTLDELQHTFIIPISESLSEVEFRRDKTPQPEISLGYIRESKKGCWILEREIGVDGEGKIRGGRGVTVSSTGETIVTDQDSQKVHVYDSDGDFKFSIDTTAGLKSGQESKPWDVAVSTDGQFFVTDQTPYVKIFTPDGEHRQFHIKSTDNITSVAMDSQLRGIVIDRKGYLLVGNSTHKYVSKHTLDGAQVSCMKVTLPPNFLATTPENQLIISPSSPNPGVQLWDDTGNRSSRYLLLQVWSPGIHGVYVAVMTISSTSTVTILDTRVVCIVSRSKGNTWDASQTL